MNKTIRQKISIPAVLTKESPAPWINLKTSPRPKKPALYTNKTIIEAFLSFKNYVGIISNVRFYKRMNE
jgi:hypothetical protein